MPGQSALNSVGISMRSAKPEQRVCTPYTAYSVEVAPRRTFPSRNERRKSFAGWNCFAGTDFALRRAHLGGDAMKTIKEVRAALVASALVLIGLARHGWTQTVGAGAAAPSTPPSGGTQTVALVGSAIVLLVVLGAL